MMPQVDNSVLQNLTGTCDVSFVVKHVVERVIHQYGDVPSARECMLIERIDHA